MITILENFLLMVVLIIVVSMIFLYDWSKE